MYQEEVYKDSRPSRDTISGVLEQTNKSRRLSHKREMSRGKQYPSW